MKNNCVLCNYTFYELRVKYNLSEQDTDRFLSLIRTKLQNENYKVYFTGAKFEYKDAKMKVQDNELMIAVKEYRDKVDVRIVGGKDVATLVDGESIKDESELNKLMPLQLLECNKLDDSYIQLKYKAKK